MSNLASDVLPEADGPTTANTEPGGTSNLRPLSKVVAWPGAEATKPSTVKCPRGAGKGMFCARSGTSANKVSSRCQAACAFTIALHCCTICVSGANKRPPSTELMIIIAAPPLSSLRNMNHAPKPNNTEPINCCNNFDAAFSPPAASEALA